MDMEKAEQLNNHPLIPSLVRRGQAAEGVLL